MKTYAGIGSRETPPELLNFISDIGCWFAEKGWVLRSGGAYGADEAFETGARFRGGACEIFRPEDSTTEAEELASKFHPAWDRCSEYVRKCHGRNMMIISGRRLIEPVQMVVCYTRDGKTSGGSGQGMRYSDHLKIPIFNLFFTDVRTAILAQIR